MTYIAIHRRVVLFRVFLLGASLPSFLFLAIANDEVQVEPLKIIYSERKRKEGKEEKSEKESLVKMRGEGGGYEGGFGEGRSSHPTLRNRRGPWGPLRMRGSPQC